MGLYVGCESAGTIPGLLNVALAPWRPTGHRYTLNKRHACDLLETAATGSEGGPVRS